MPLFMRRCGVREVLRSRWHPILHLAQITELMTAMMFPKKLAIVKCQAHKKDNTAITRGNNAANEAAKAAAAGSKMAIMALVVTIQPQLMLDYIAAMQVVYQGDGSKGKGKRNLSKQNRTHRRQGHKEV